MACARSSAAPTSSTPRRRARCSPTRSPSTWPGSAGTAGLVLGPNPEDKALAEAYRRAAKRFGIKIVEERVYNYDPGSRRSDGGFEQIQQQMPSFTQNAKEHDVVIVVDEGNLFADYLPYRTWEAKPVVGSAGLVPTTWHPAVEWGGTQFQNRFKRMSGRTMRPLDYNVWMAVRSIGEAATRTKSNAPAELIKYIGSKEFELAAFKGQKLTYRDWNGQLRQPLPLVTGKLHVTVSPQPGFLHQLRRHARHRPARDEVPGLHAMTVPRRQTLPGGPT